jgi:hypothetical protein
MVRKHGLTIDLQSVDWSPPTAASSGECRRAPRLLGSGGGGGEFGVAFQFRLEGGSSGWRGGATRHARHCCAAGRLRHGGADELTTSLFTPAAAADFQPSSTASWWRSLASAAGDPNKASDCRATRQLETDCRHHFTMPYRAVRATEQAIPKVRGSVGFHEFSMPHWRSPRRAANISAPGIVQLRAPAARWRAAHVGDVRPP